MPSARPPASAICAASLSSRSWRRATSTTWSPRSARWRAVASPMPELAPVTMATRFSKLYDDTTAVRVAIVGAGLMGAQIGCEYALGGHDVVIELKSTVLRAVLPAAPEAVVATNTSSLSIGTLGDAVGRPERTVGTHYLNPPLLMPTVEVIAGERTSADTVAFARDTLATLGKLPVVARRDVPGFVWNRLPLRSIALGGIGVAITSGDLAGDAARRDAALARELEEERRGAS
jgi:3-hydroxyacyl-CoA dehydrogenase, NAD binding domain